MFGFRKPPAPIPDDPDACVILCADTADPREKRRILEHALAVAPGHLKANRALMMLGDLGRTRKIEADFSLIKCYLLTAFEKPDMFSAQKRRDMTREIFDHPLLAKCLALCPEEERDGFLRDYIQELCDDYGELFIGGASQYSGGILGFSTPDSRVRARSVPFARVLNGIMASEDLSDEEKQMLLKAVYQSARVVLHGNMKRLHEGLEPRVLSALNA